MYSELIGKHLVIDCKEIFRVYVHNNITCQKLIKLKLTIVQKKFNDGH